MEKIDKVVDFCDFNEDCPSYIESGYCALQVFYNGSVNDVRYSACCEETCPIFYWVKKFIAKNI